MDKQDAYERYKSSFPSDTWLLKYFGRDTNIDGSQHRLYDDLRHLFSSTLTNSPKHILKAKNRSGEEFFPVYVFRNGKPEPWVDPQLENQGLMLALPQVAFHELCLEFITHFHAGVFHTPSEWKWCAEGASIWIEVIPNALVGGRLKRRTLADIFDKPSKLP